MDILKHKIEIKRTISKYKSASKTVGFVPTMGTLHQGHISLVEKCNNENDITVVSIFVNPTQFNDKKDYNNYPRNIEKDINILKNENVDLIFIPSEQEMYPKPSNIEIFNFGHLDKIMEGKYRKGHFNGVANIISMLFKIVEPDRAYFGEKDFQQLVIIRHLVEKIKMKIEIIACPILRESNGLAMSSRNLLLNKEEKKNAGHISRTLFKVRDMAGKHSVKDVKKWVINEINKNPFLNVEYFDIVDTSQLSDIKEWSEAKFLIACIAVKIGKIRLIDNVIFNS
ncbi:MAG: pantoate--beta-alanine ligase [Bacteroidales bacterium]|nr:pantoate--beta-alanine ligase [Bacteroidales bacterium]